MSADATQSGAEVLLRALKDQGVEVIFGYPGGAVLPIYDALFKQNAIRHILVRQEGGAVHAAEGYARSTGCVGVVLVTSGPGATNAVTVFRASHQPCECLVGWRRHLYSSRSYHSVVGVDSTANHLVRAGGTTAAARTPTVMETLRNRQPKSNPSTARENRAIWTSNSTMPRCPKNLTAPCGVGWLSFGSGSSRRRRNLQ